MSTVDPELKRQAEAEASARTDYEHQRIDSYRSLRCDFKCTTVEEWLNILFNSQKADCKEEKAPSQRQIRKDAGVSFWEDAFSFLSPTKKKAIAEKKEQSRVKLQNKVDEINNFNRAQCAEANRKLANDFVAKHNRLISGNKKEVEEYFTYCLSNDCFILDSVNRFVPDFNLVFIPVGKCLVIDYKLPLMNEIPRVKEWNVGKDNDIIPKEMNKTDYLELYERVLFDLSMRAVGILFTSDDRNVLDKIVFNGSSVYTGWQSMPTMILSFEMSKNQYSYARARQMDFVSKAEIAKLNNAVYLGDIHSEKPPADLWETPPSKLVVPIKSSF